MPVVTLTGPRQSGKTTICRSCFPDHTYSNLEIPDTRRFALDDPRGFLKQFPDGAVIDEVQRCPDLLSYIQAIVDESQNPGQWILTGSQNLLLLDSVSQTLAGRSAILHLLTLSYDEVQRFPSYPTDLDTTLLTGGYPRIHDKAIPPIEFLDGYIATYVERDVRSISNVTDLIAFQRFLSICAGRTGQLLNFTSLSADCGVSQPTIKAWLSILETCFIILRLPAWHGNLRKRIVKAPKLHFWDSGLVCRLLGIRTEEQLRIHPLRGSIFESWAVSEIAKRRLQKGEPTGLFHFRDRHRNEVDLIEETSSGLNLIEIKSGQTVSSDMWGGFKKALDILPESAAVRQHVIFGGDQTQSRTDVTITPWRQIHQ